MEWTMIHRSLSYDPTTEHRLTRAKWARGFGVVYGTILLLLLAIAGAQHFRVEHNGATIIANDPAAQPMRTDLRPTIARGAPTAPRAANTISHAE
jgi:hypothetical protein